MKKTALFGIAIAVALTAFGTSAQAHCQQGYDCWARSQGHYGYQQRWSYGERRMFQPAVTHGHRVHRHQQQHLVHRETIVQKRTVAVSRQHQASRVITKQGKVAPQSQAFSVYYDQSAGAKTVTGVKREQHFGWAKYYDQ